MRRLPTDPAELRAYLSSLKVEHDTVLPDEIPGHWEARRREHDMRRALAAGLSVAGPHAVVTACDTAAITAGPDAIVRCG